MSETKKFLENLNAEVQRHPAINHSFLEMVASRRFSKQAWLAFAQQLYPHVHFFIPYMEEMLLNTFDMNAKLIVAKILLDEYGEDAGGKSHPELFRRFVRACGGPASEPAAGSSRSDGPERRPGERAENDGPGERSSDRQAADASLLTTPLDPVTIDLVQTHMRLCGQEPFLVAIGTIGEAHEYAIRFLFPPLVKGMQLAGFSAEEIEFFSLHVDHDVEHSSMLEDAMIRLAKTDEDREQIRRGTLASLACRADLWSAMQRRMVAIDSGTEAPTSNRNLIDLTKTYKNVPDTFWPA